MDGDEAVLIADAEIVCFGRTLEQLTASVNKLVEVTNRDAVDIRALARIVESHDRRIADIEGRQP